MEKQQTLTKITTKTILGMDSVIEEAKPDLILVHGDTSTTFAGALSAFYHQVPIGHVEAGLRTGDKYSPYPEEMNRVPGERYGGSALFSHQGQCGESPSEDVKGQIFITGNTAIDAMKTTVRDDFVFSTQCLNELDFNPSGSLSSLATAEKITVNPWSISCTPLQSWWKAIPMWKWSIPST